MSAFTIQKSTRPIKVLTLTNSINTVKLILNQIFMALVYIILISILLFIVVLYTRYCLQPIVDFLKVPILIITLQNSLGVQYFVVIYINRSCLQSIISIIGAFINQLLGTIVYIKKQSVNIVVILKAQLSIKGLKVVKNISKVFYF